MKHKKMICGVIGLIVLFLVGYALHRMGEIRATETRQIENQNSTQISFSWWGNDNRHAYTLKGVELFEQRNPEIDVQVQYGVWNGYEKRTKVMMKSHTESDVMQINYAWLAEYSPDGEGYADLYQYADQIDFSNFTEEDLRFGEVNGKLNALPIAYNMPTFYFNQDLYEKYGLEIPKTWEDLFAAARVMRADGVYPLGALYKQLWMALIAWYEQDTGDAVFSENGELLLNEEELGEILHFYERLVEEKVIMPPSSFGEQFATGEVAGVLVWISDADRYCNDLVERGNTVVAGTPITMDGAKRCGWYLKPATMYAISNISEHPKEAAMLLNFLLNDGHMAVLQGTEKGIPASKNAVQTLERKGEMNTLERMANDQLVALREDLGVIHPIMENEDVINAFKNVTTELTYNEGQRKDCAAEFYEAIQSIQDAAKG